MHTTVSRLRKRDSVPALELCNLTVTLKLLFIGYYPAETWKYRLSAVASPRRYGTHNWWYHKRWCPCACKHIDCANSGSPCHQRGWANPHAYDDWQWHFCSTRSGVLSVRTEQSTVFGWKQYRSGQKGSRRKAYSSHGTNGSAIA